MTVQMKRSSKYPPLEGYKLFSGAFRKTWCCCTSRLMSLCIFSFPPQCSQFSSAGRDRSHLLPAQASTSDWKQDLKSQQMKVLQALYVWISPFSRFLGWTEKLRNKLFWDSVMNESWLPGSESLLLSSLPTPLTPAPYISRDSLHSHYLPFPYCSPGKGWAMAAHVVGSPELRLARVEPNNTNSCCAHTALLLSAEALVKVPLFLLGCQFSWSLCALSIAGDVTSLQSLSETDLRLRIYLRQMDWQCDHKSRLP